MVCLVCDVVAGGSVMRLAASPRHHLCDRPRLLPRTLGGKPDQRCYCGFTSTGVCSHEPQVGAPLRLVFEVRRGACPCPRSAGLLRVWLGVALGALPSRAHAGPPTAPLSAQDYIGRFSFGRQSARIRPYAFTVALPDGAGDCFRVRPRLRCQSTPVDSPPLQHDRLRLCAADASPPASSSLLGCGCGCGCPPHNTAPPSRSA
jgi:hypothetical protein